MTSAKGAEWTMRGARGIESARRALSQESTRRAC